MRRHRITLGMLMSAVALAASGCAALIAVACRQDFFLIGYAVGPFLVIFGPWLLVGLTCYLFLTPPAPSSKGKGKTKADPLDL